MGGFNLGRAINPRRFFQEQEEELRRRYLPSPQDAIPEPPDPTEPSFQEPISAGPYRDGGESLEPQNPIVPVRQAMADGLGASEPWQASPDDMMTRLPRAPQLEEPRAEPAPTVKGALKHALLGMVPGYSELERRQRTSEELGRRERNTAAQNEYNRQMGLIGPALRYDVQASLEEREKNKREAFFRQKFPNAPERMVYEAREGFRPKWDEQAEEKLGDLFKVKRLSGAEVLARRGQRGGFFDETTGEPLNDVADAWKIGTQPQESSSTPLFQKKLQDFESIMERPATAEERLRIIGAAPPQPLAPWVFPSFNQRGELTGVASASRDRSGGVGDIKFKEAPDTGEPMRRTPMSQQDLASKAGLKRALDLLPEYEKLANANRAFIGFGGGVTGAVGRATSKSMARLQSLYNEMKSEIVRRGGAAIPKHEIETILGPFHDPSGTFTSENEFFEGLDVFKNELHRKYIERFGEDPVADSAGGLPAAAAAKLQVGLETTFANGQVWTKTPDGQPKRVR